MPRSPFHRLRRCRALFALALCAWLALAGAAWAKVGDGCCPYAGMAASMVMPGMDMAAHGVASHDAMPSPDGGCMGVCMHAFVALPATLLPELGHVAPQADRWPSGFHRSPQPLLLPPLRPPLA